MICRWSVPNPSGRCIEMLLASISSFRRFLNAECTYFVLTDRVQLVASAVGNVAAVLHYNELASDFDESMYGWNRWIPARIRPGETEINVDQGVFLVGDPLQLRKFCSESGDRVGVLEDPWLIPKKWGAFGCRVPRDMRGLSTGLLIQQPQVNIAVALQREARWWKETFGGQRRGLEADAEGASVCALEELFHKGRVFSLPATLYRTIDPHACTSHRSIEKAVAIHATGDGRPAYNWFRESIEVPTVALRPALAGRVERKLALGFFHFNVQWVAGDVSSYHRCCCEILSPFLQTLLEHPNWRLTLEVSGSGLEFVNNWYPNAFRSLRALVDRGQIELVSTLYSPSIWIAFPARDLRRSVECNQRVLKQLGIAPSRIFFGQEAFIGEGVRTLSDFFDIAICHDEYLRYFYDVDLSGPYCLLGDMKIVPASNHIMNTLPVYLQTNKSTDGIPEYYIDIVAKYREFNEANTFPGRQGTWRGTEWYWYHFGAVRHFSTLYPPNDQRGAKDDLWFMWNKESMTQLESEGYEFATVSEFVSALADYPARSLPPLVESGWNPRRSNGVFCWMGWHANRWEADAMVLSSVAQGRARLIACEDAASSAEGPELTDEWREGLEAGWRALLFAESSDSLGWEPTAAEVMFAVGAADEVRRIADNLWHELLMHESGAARERQRPDTTNVRWERKRNEEAPASLTGARGSLDVFSVSPQLDVLEACFFCEIPPSGVRFPLAVDCPYYCPSGLETEPVRLVVSSQKPDVLYLPLANGLIQIGTDTFVIKDTRLVHVAAGIDRPNRSVDFVVGGDVDGRQMRWRFYLLHGNIAMAVQFANQLNYV